MARHRCGYKEGTMLPLHSLLLILCQNTDSNIEHVLREAAVMASLDHEYILPLIGYSIVGDTEAWIITPVVEGGSLFSFIHSNTQIGWNTRLQLALHAATAISYMHSRPDPIVHRDIKSSNFLVRDGTKLVLCDFGLASVKRELEVPHAGTPAYMAPELWTSKPATYTEKADIYSLGMVPLSYLYFCLKKLIL